MRKDGVKLRNSDPMYQLIPYIMVDRNDAMNMIELFLPVEPMNNYIHAQHENNVNISHLSLIIAAYVRTLAEFPTLNRFIVNRKIYARKGIQIGMVVMKPGSDVGTMNKMYFDPADDIFEVNRKVLSYVDENRKAGETNATDKLMATLLKIPGLARVGVGLIIWADKHGLLPESILKASPFHASMTITNLASIRTNHIYHHIYNFGTNSELISMGNLREVPRRDGRGGIVFERCLPLGVVMDERVADGLYFAKAFRRMQSYLKDPTQLEGPPKVCIREWEEMARKPGKNKK